MNPEHILHRRKPVFVTLKGGGVIIWRITAKRIATNLPLLVLGRSTTVYLGTMVAVKAQVHEYQSHEKNT